MAQDWWATLNRMSKAELYFEQTLDAHNKISTRNPRAMVIRVIDGVESFALDFQEPEKLLAHLNRGSVSHQSRDLIILEDLSREWVEAIGPRLNIPVYVFALHWANPRAHVNGQLRVPIGESPARHFILSYRQALPFCIKNRQNNIAVNGVDKEFEYRLDCNVLRPIASQSEKYDDNEPETSEQLVTYYAFDSSTAAGSILLIDPMITTHDTAVRKVALSDFEDLKGSSEEIREYARCKSVTCPAIPPLSGPNQAMEGANRQEDDDPSLFGDLKLFDPGPISSHYLGSTHRIRRLVLARNVATIHSLLRDTLQLTGKASIGVAKIAEFNFNDFEKRAWVDEWRGTFFRQLWTLREELEFQGYKIQQNLRVVQRIADIVGMAKLGPSLYREQQQADRIEWEELEELRLYAFKIMERTTDSYLQTVQATGAQFANKQAKSVGQVTGLVGLFVPGSLCAAVLAIPNYGGTNQNQKFWIFWAVSVPLAIILMVLFFTSWPKRIHNHLKNLLWRHEKSQDPEYLRRPRPVDASGSMLKWFNKPSAREWAGPEKTSAVMTSAV